MRKTTSYARKVRRNVGMYGEHSYNGLAFASVIQRCRPYTGEEIPCLKIEATDTAAFKAMAIVRKSFEMIRNGNSAPDADRDFATLAHAMGVTEIRSIDIAGQVDNPMLPVCKAGNDALERCRVRRIRFGKWEFDKPAIQELSNAIELYETVVQASSPAQMEETTVRWIEILAMKRSQEITI
jgi:hypothetical protein